MEEAKVSKNQMARDAKKMKKKVAQALAVWNLDWWYSGDPEGGAEAPWRGRE